MISTCNVWTDMTLLTCKTPSYPQLVHPPSPWRLVRVLVILLQLVELARGRHNGDMLPTHTILVLELEPIFTCPWVMFPRNVPTSHESKVILDVHLCALDNQSINHQIIPLSLTKRSWEGIVPPEFITSQIDHVSLSRAYRRKNSVPSTHHLDRNDRA